MKNIRRLVCLAVCFVGSNSAQAIVTNWTVQSASSTLTISSAILSSGGVIEANLETQGIGSLTTTYGGTITTQQAVSSGTPTDIELLSASVVANNSGSWDPLPGGATGTAPANYGVRYGEFITTVSAALRNIEFDLSGGLSPLTGTLPFQHFNSNITATFASGVMDTRIFSVALDSTGLNDPSSFLSSGAVSYAPTLTTMTIPITLEFSSITIGSDTTDASDDFAIYFNVAGYLIATAPTETVPEANSLALLGLAGSIVGFMGYRRKQISQAAGI